MKNFTFTSEVTPSSAQEITLRARAMERRQAIMLADLTAEVRPEKKNRRSILQALMAIFLIFGAPRQF